MHREGAVQRGGTGSAVFLGLTTLDVIHRIAGELRPGRKGVAESTEVAAGGPAANAAITCAALGVPATLISALGTGAAGGSALGDLVAHGVRPLDVAGPDWPMPVASCIVHGDGERTVVSTGALAGRSVADELDDAARQALRHCPVLLLDGHHPDLAEQALDVIAPETLVVLDAGSAKPRAEQWLSRVDVLAASADYSAGLGLDAPAAAAHALARGVQVALVTDGAESVRWWWADGSTGSTAPPQVEARDTLGAGDAFHGALVAELLVAGSSWRAGLPDAVARAVQVASHRVRTPGARGWLATLEPLTSKLAPPLH